MQTKLEPVNSIKQKVVVSLDPAEVKSCKDSLYRILKQEVEVKGFRLGRAPEDMIVKQIGDEMYRKRLVKQVVTDTYPKAVMEVHARPISDPEIELKDYKMIEGTMIYEATFEIIPEVDANDYKGVSLVKADISVSGDDVQRELVGMQRSLMQLEPAGEGLIDDGMLAVIEFKGTVEGKPFEGSESDNFIVETDVGGLLPDFLSQIKGMKSGEEKTVAFAYPGDYFNKDIAGKNAEFLVRVKDIRKKIMPDINDDFAKNFGPFNTLDDLRTEIKSRLVSLRENRERARLEREAVSIVASRNPFEVPPALISFELGQMLEELAANLASRGKTLEEANINTEQFVRENYDEAMLRAKWYVLGETIAKKENLAATPEDINERIKFLARYHKKKESELMPAEGSPQWESLSKSIRLSKALKFILDNAKVDNMPYDADAMAAKALGEKGEAQAKKETKAPKQPKAPAKKRSKK